MHGGVHVHTCAHVSLNERPTSGRTTVDAVVAATLSISEALLHKAFCQADRLPGCVLADWQQLASLCGTSEHSAQENSLHTLWTPATSGQPARAHSSQKRSLLGNLLTQR